MFSEKKNLLKTKSEIYNFCTVTKAIRTHIKKKKENYVFVQSIYASIVTKSSRLCTWVGAQNLKKPADSRNQSPNLRKSLQPIEIM